MNRFRSLLAEHRAMTFVLVTFLLTWLYEFAVVYPLVGSDLSSFGGPSFIQTLAIAAAMFFPAIGVVITRLITGDGFKNCVIKPYPLKRSLPWFAVAWLGPSVLVLIGAVLYFAIFPGDFNPNGTAFAQLIETQLEQAGAPAELPMSIQMMAIVQIAVGTLFGPLANFVACFGEEWGWRGYLMPKLGHRKRIVPTLIITGVIWGLWHAPLTALGHNYGAGYFGWPILGIIAMCCFCTVFGIFLSYVTIRTGSCLAAVFGHGAVNAVAGAATIFASADVSPFVGPLPTGIIGGAAFIAVALLMLFDLRKRERSGGLEIPQAGRP